MVQKVVGSIPITHPISECSTAVSIQVFQTWDESSILSTRTKLKRKNIYVLYFLIACTRKFAKQSYSHQVIKKKSICALIFLFRLFVKFGGNAGDLPRHPKLEILRRIQGAN